MEGYNPNASMLPASGGTITPMSGGGVAVNGGGCSPAITSNGGGLVFANGGAEPKDSISLANPTKTDNLTLAKQGLAASQQPSKTPIIPSSSNPIEQSNISQPITSTEQPKAVIHPSTEQALELARRQLHAATIRLKQKSNSKENRVLQTLINSKITKNSRTYTEQEQDTLLKNLTPLLKSNPKDFRIEIKPSITSE